MVVHRTLSIVVLGLALVTACSKKSSDGSGAASESGGKVASCNMPTLQSCREYRGANLALGIESLAKLCAVGNFTLTETPCPTENIIGVCAMNEGTDFYYVGYPIPAAELGPSCTSRGHKFRAK